ncbi:MAG: polysaccharide deacetylase family protein [Bacteriovorax sp.]
MKNLLLILGSTILIASPKNYAKEVALTFDDAPTASSLHFTSLQRTEELIKKLKVLNVSQVMVFANACKGQSTEKMLAQLKKYKDAGHLIENHTCSHPRLDEVGFKVFSEDVEKGDKLLTSLFEGQKFFRYPYLNEGKDISARDEMRQWLKKNNGSTLLTVGAFMNSSESQSFLNFQTLVR